MSQASAFVRHAETIAQTRFNNYLVADSLLLLAWATLFSGQRPGSRLVLIVLAALSAVLGFFWMILGTRQGKFLKLHLTHLVTLEHSLRPSFWIGGPMEDLRDGGQVPINSEGVMRLRWIETWITPTMLISIGPGVLSAISLILVWVSVRPLGYESFEHRSAGCSPVPNRPIYRGLGYLATDSRPALFLMVSASLVSNS